VKKDQNVLHIVGNPRILPDPSGAGLPATSVCAILYPCVSRFYGSIFSQVETRCVGGAKNCNPTPRKGQQRTGPGKQEFITLQIGFVR